MATTENIHYRFINKTYTYDEAHEVSEYLLENDRTGDGIGFKWVDANTKQPISGTYFY